MRSMPKHEITSKIWATFSNPINRINIVTNLFEISAFLSEVTYIRYGQH
jgi:hypothetical protein